RAQDADFYHSRSAQRGRVGERVVEDVECAPAPNVDLEAIAGLLVGDEHVDIVLGRVPVEGHLDAVVLPRCQLFEVGDGHLSAPRGSVVTSRTVTEAANSSLTLGRDGLDREAEMCDAARKVRME